MNITPGFTVKSLIVAFEFKVIVPELIVTDVLKSGTIPQFQFAGTEPDEIGNATNRSPYPTLHLLREDSVERAVAAFPEAAAIFENNIRTLEQLGAPGWADLQAQCRLDAQAGER